MSWFVCKVVEFDEVVIHFDAMIDTVFPTFDSVISITQWADRGIPEASSLEQHISEEISVQVIMISVLYSIDLVF